VDRVFLVAVVLPVFGLLRAVLAAPLAGRPYWPSPDRIAPPLYVAVLAGATIGALIQIGGDPAELSLLPSGTLAVAVLSTVAILPVGLLGGVAAYLAELWIISRPLRGRTGDTVPDRSGSDNGAIRAVQTWVSNPVVFLAFGALTALFEELLWRGYLLHGLSADVGAIPALAAQAVLFGLNHVPFGPRTALAKAGSAVLWGVMVVMLDTVLVGIVAHLVFQVLAFRRLRRQSVRGGASVHVAHHA
jgi:membrane protease YdiL (CAAX protease family)